MNPRIEWLAREVLPTLYGLWCGRTAVYEAAHKASEDARRAAVRAQYRESEALAALRELRDLLKGVGYTEQQLDQFAAGPAAPPAVGMSSSIHDDEVTL